MNSEKHTTKYIIYARKSSESDERQVQSIEDQIRIMRDFALKSGLKVVGELTESKSAKDPNGRTKFNEMIERIEDGEANGVLTWKMDRLARNPVDSGRIQWLLEKKKIVSIQTQEREYRPEDNALILSVESGMAYQYVRDLSTSVKRGLKSKLEKGWLPGSAPLGYLNTKTEARGDNYILVDPERFGLLRKAWDLMLTGNYTPPQILEKLNNDWGFRTRKWKKRGSKPMSRSTIYKIFNNPFYAGIILYKGNLYEGNHKAMVTVEEFDKVQVLLGRDGRPRPSRYEYAYTGMVTCGECGGAVSATFKEKILVSTGELKKYILYYCVNARKDKNACSQRHYTNVDLIEDQVKEEIEKFTILPEFKDWALQILSERNENELESQRKIREIQKANVCEVEKQIENLTRLRLQELIDDGEFAKERDRLKSELVGLKKKVQEDDGLEKRLEMVEKNFEFACQAREWFESGDLEVKRGILSSIGLNCELKDHKVLIESPDWLVSIKKSYPPLELAFKEFELDKKPYTQRQKEAFASLSPLMRGRRDLNPRSPP